MNKVRAIYGNGVFRPEGRIELPEGTAVELEIRLEPITIPPLDPQKKLSAINAILVEQQKVRSHSAPVRRAEDGI